MSGSLRTQRILPILFFLIHGTSPLSGKKHIASVPDIGLPGMTSVSHHPILLLQGSDILLTMFHLPGIEMREINHILDPQLPA